MKKFWAIFGAILFIVIDIFVIWVAFFKDKGESQQPPDIPIEEIETGDITVQVDGVYQIAISDTGATELGGANGKVVLYGNKEGATIKAIGSGRGTIQAAEGGTLVFKNLRIVDETTDVYTKVYWSYLRFGGKLQFENCTIENSIYITDEAEAKFINCTFTSGKTSYYSVWVADGNASFIDCEFTGYRGIKIHEFTGEDVKEVTINGCEFRNLTEKVGIAIGTFGTNAKNTSITILNSKFIGCQAWDKEGSLNGVDGFYEADIDLSEIEFAEVNNIVEYKEGLPDWTDFY